MYAKVVPDVKKQEVATMRHTNIKFLVVACVATIFFISIHNKAAEAYTGEKVEKDQSFWELGQNKSETQEDKIPTEDLSEIPDKTKVLAEKTVSPDFRKDEKESVSLSKNEKNLVARLVQAEAKGEPFQGKVGVATVVLNRVESSKFPDSVTGVIKQKVGDAYAFTPVQNGEIKKAPSEEAKKAVKVALERKNRLNNSTFFYNPKTATDNWIRSRKVVKKIGHHVFAK